MCANVLDPATGTKLAILGFVEGLKTMPYPEPRSRKWYEFWK